MTTAPYRPLFIDPREDPVIGMIRNLTDEPVRYYQPGTPDVLPHEHRDLGLLQTWDAAENPAHVTTEHCGEALPLHHDGQDYPADLVTYCVQGLPDHRSGVRLIVTPEVAMAIRGRSDLVLVADPVRTADGEVLGYRRLGSVC